MWRITTSAALTLGFILLSTSDASAQKKKKGVVETATDQDYKALQSVKELTGSLTEVNATSASNSVVFRLDIPHLTPNPKYHPPKGTNQQYQQLKNIYRQQAKIMATKNPIQRQIRMQQLMATMQSAYYQQLLQAAVASNNPNSQPFLLAHQYKDFQLDLADNAAIRKMSPGPEFDEKGNRITYTKEMKDELKGDKTKPGYMASLLDLTAGEMVKISLKMPKKSKPAPASEKADDKDKDAEKANPATDEAAAADDKNAAKDAGKQDGVVKPVITMIVILQAVDGGPMLDGVPAKTKGLKVQIESSD